MVPGHEAALHAQGILRIVAAYAARPGPHSLAARVFASRSGTPRLDLVLSGLIALVMVERLDSVSPRGIVAIDENWTIAHVSPTAAELLQRDDLVGRHLWDEYPLGVGTAFWREYHLARDTGERREFVECYPGLGWFHTTVDPTSRGLIVSLGALPSALLTLSDETATGLGEDALAAN